MRFLPRRGLSAELCAALDSAAAQVAAADDARAEAKRLWDSRRSTPAFQGIRKQLRAMASGRERCMYCEDSAGSVIEHFFPKADHPHRAFRWDNFIWACQPCNNIKQKNGFPCAQDGSPLLVDPTAEADDPRLHLVFSPKTGHYRPRSDPETKQPSPRGEATIDVLELWRQTLAKGRKTAWHNAQAMIIRYGQLMTDGLAGEANLVAAELRDSSFSGVLAHLVAMVASPGRSLVDPRCRSVMETHPHLLDWVHPMRGTR